MFKADMWCRTEITNVSCGAYISTSLMLLVSNHSTVICNTPNFAHYSALLYSVFSPSLSRAAQSFRHLTNNKSPIRELMQSNGDMPLH